MKRFRHRRLHSIAWPLAVVGAVLMLSPAANSAPEQEVTLNVTLAGPGTGTVTSYPAGIDCGTAQNSVCSAQFPDQTTVSLDAQGEGSNPTDCSATPPYACEWVYVPFPTGPPHSEGYTVDLDYGNLGPTAAVQVTFSPTAPPHCIVPRARGRTLAIAKARIRQSHCGVGTIAHAFSRTVSKGRVLSQYPKQRVRQPRGATVDLVVSKGRR